MINSLQAEKPLFSVERARAVLQQHFGYSSFRPGQEEIIRSIAEGRDTLVIMPTGGGKSLCYQIPALLLPGTALVISPLIALMKDQVDALERAGISATLINSSLDPTEIRRRLDEARKGTYKLVYVAPERLESEYFLELAQEVAFSFLAVDEAHCISEWGHDFRPSYTRIAQGNARLGNLPIIALTATATPEVQDDIVKSLELRSPQRFTKGFNRPNLRYHVEFESQKVHRAAQLCANIKGSCVVYCGSRKRVEDFAESLRAEKIPAKAYHGGMKQETRREIQDWFAHNENAVIVATNAFGMGVDKPNVRVVIHCDLPLTLEAYYQEAGRAGRDGKLADCYILYETKDRGLPEFFLRCTFPEEDVLQKVYTYLYDATRTPRGTKPIRPLMEDEIAIANALSLHSMTVAAALALFERQKIIQRGSTEGNATIMFTTTRERLNEYYRQCNVEQRKKTLTALARLGGPQAFEQPTEFNFTDISQKHDIHPDQALSEIRALEYARLLRFQPPGSGGGITILADRAPFAQAGIDTESLRRRRIHAMQKLDTVIRYAETTDCKRNFLLSYFQESDVQGNCGECSSCHGGKKRTTERIGYRREKLIKTIVAAAAELNNRWGKTVLIEVLAGKRSEKVLRFALDKAATFGSAAAHNETSLQEAVEQAIAHKLLTISADTYPTIQPSEAGYLLLGKQIPKPFATQQDGMERCSYPELLERCLALRRELSLRDELPEQAIIDDKSLRLLVNTLPSSVRKVRSLHFLSEQVRTRYAASFARVVAEYLSAEQGEQQQTDLSEQYRKSLTVLQQGLSFEEAALARGVAPATFANHCEHIISLGIEVDRKNLVNNTLFQEVLAVLRIRPHETLKGVRASVQTQCSLPLLRIAVAFARQTLQTESVVAEKRGFYGKSR